MTNPIHTAICEAANYTDKDAFVSDLALSSIWGDGLEDDIPPARLETLGALYDGLAGVRELCDAFGVSYRGFARRFGIPVRTMEDWCSGARTPPPYVVTMAAELLAADKIACN